MPLTFVTSNEHKFEEISTILKEEFDIELVRKEMDFVEFSNQSLKEIALQKARQAFEHFRIPLIVEDTGFFFAAYKNFPGTEPKRAFEALGFEGLLKLLKGKSRQAYSEAVICFFEGENSHKLFDGKFEGKIATKVVKPNAKVMPYEKIFIPKGEKRALAEMSREEKNAISHRGIATRKLGKWLKERALDDLLESIE